MRLENDVAWVEIAEDVGPRIMGYGRTGGDNVFARSDVGRDTPAGRWRAYGGHRCWLAPERFPATYRLDDVPPRVQHSDRSSAVVTHGGDENGIVTELDVALAADGTVSVVHRAHNASLVAQTFALWGLSVMRSGGEAVLARASRRSHHEALEPAETLALWAYAPLTDPRVRCDPDALRVRCDPAVRQPWKIGTSGETGKCSYVLEDVTFVVEITPLPGAAYPDRGCAFEVFTEGSFIELETLGPLETVSPGGTAVHVERWSLVEPDRFDAVMETHSLTLADGRTLITYAFNDV